MMAGVSEIRIRSIETLSEYEQCVEVQRLVWELPDVELVPATELLVVDRYGGACIGAFDGAAMVGFVCGMVARDESRVFHHSQLLGVVPAYRGRRIGEDLKWAQRDRVLSQGLDLVSWTFDPLQAPNANLNINRLGVVIREYVVNLYGEGISPLHGALPTDRFEAEWWLESPRVREARNGKGPDRVGWQELPCVSGAVQAGGFPRCEDVRLDLDDPELLVEVPPNITTMMDQDPDLALDWRLKTRTIFQTYMGRGYAVVGFHRSEGHGYYRMQR
jgi:predicted GNAT superfamily acetyltransferase